MAIYIHCPHCNRQLTEMHPECTHCGMALPQGVLYSLACALGQTEVAAMGFTAQTSTQRTSSPSFPSHLLTTEGALPPRYSALRPWLAAILSLLWGGGQLYNGQIKKGCLLLGCGVVAVLIWPFLLGKVLACCLWLYAVADAYLVARRTASGVT